MQPVLTETVPGLQLDTDRDDTPRGDAADGMLHASTPSKQRPPPPVEFVYVETPQKVSVRMTVYLHVSLVGCCVGLAYRASMLVVTFSYRGFVSG